jgi:hypothetical protein
MAAAVLRQMLGLRVIRASGTVLADVVLLAA